MYNEHKPLLNLELFNPHGTYFLGIYYWKDLLFAILLPQAFNFIYFLSKIVSLKKKSID